MLLWFKLAFYFLNINNPQWNSLSHGLSIFQVSKLGDKNTLKLEANAGAVKVCLFFDILEFLNKGGDSDF